MKQGLQKRRDPAHLYRGEMYVIRSINRCEYTTADVGDLTPLKVAITTSPVFMLRASHMWRNQQAARIHLPFQCVWQLKHARTPEETRSAIARFDHHVEYGFRVVDANDVVAQHDRIGGPPGVLVEWRLILNQNDGTDYVRAVGGVFRLKIY
jgi:hypothetical protein